MEEKNGLLNDKIEEQDNIIKEMNKKYINLDNEHKTMLINLKKRGDDNEQLKDKVNNLFQNLNELQIKYSELSNQYLVLNNNYDKFSTLNSKDKENINNYNYEMDERKNKSYDASLSDENKINLNYLTFQKSKNVNNRNKIENIELNKEQEDLQLKTSDSESFNVEKENKGVKIEINSIKKIIGETNIEYNNVKMSDYQVLNNKVINVDENYKKREINDLENINKT